MTTYEEISTIKHLNRMFWNCELKFHLARRREALKLQKGSCYIRAIRNVLKNRAKFEYYHL